MSEIPLSSGMDAYNELLGILKDIAMMDQVRSLLGWDQEVLMPPKAAELRGEQIAWISRESHKRKTSPRVGELLDELEERDDLGDIESANVRLAREAYDKATRLPTGFVSELAKHICAARRSELDSITSNLCLFYTAPSPRDGEECGMEASA